jgi:hypothetical protein
MLKSIVFFLLSASTAHAQTKLISVTATLPAGVARKNVRLVVFVDGSTAENPCSPSGVADNEAIFECAVKLDARSGVFVFRIPGYKPYSITAADLDKKANRGFAVLPLGAVHPADAEDPRIDNVVSTRSQDGTLRFQITVNNLSTKKIPITEIKMNGRHMVGCGVSPGGHMPPNPTTRFTISDRLLLTPYKTGKAGITGTISDAGDHPEFPFPVTGTGLSAPCSGRSFSLSAPVNFTIPDQGLFEIELLMPVGRKHPSGGADSPNTLATGEVVGRFPEIHFALLTADKDHPEISSDYGGH